jgi:hypothetical protein
MPVRSGGRKPPGPSSRQSSGRRGGSGGRGKDGPPRKTSGPRRNAAVFPPDAQVTAGPLDGAFTPDFRPPFRTESPAGLRNEIADLRAEVHRLAAEIDKLWARDRGRSTAGGAGRTARSIAGKPVRTGTRASKPGTKRTSLGAPAATPRPPVRAGAPTRRSATAGKPAGSPGGVKRGAGWAKAAPRRVKGATAKRRGR